MSDQPTPEADGKLVIAFTPRIEPIGPVGVFDLQRETRTYPLNDISWWTARDGILVVESERARECFPLTSLESFTVIPNSPEVAAAIYQTWAGTRSEEFAKYGSLPGKVINWH